MARTPDNFFDVAIVDPPYGIGIDGQKKSICKNPKHNRKAHVQKNWDAAIPPKEYFDELFRVSKNQIIWGGNYFTKFLYPTRSWIFWYKMQNDLTMSDGEMAWTSFNNVTRQISITRGELQKQDTMHPTEKPVKLYKTLLSNFCKRGDKILDTHGGSLSIGIACHDLGFDLVACELDPEYFQKAKQRLDNHIFSTLQFPE